MGRLSRFNLICLAGIGWSVLLVNLFARGLGWNVYLANLVAIGLVSLWNFGLAWRWGWRLPASQNPETPFPCKGPGIWWPSGSEGTTR